MAFLLLLIHVLVAMGKFLTLLIEPISATEIFPFVIISILLLFSFLLNLVRDHAKRHSHHMYNSQISVSSLFVSFHAVCGAMYLIPRLWCHVPHP